MCGFAIYPCRTRLHCFRALIWTKKVKIQCFCPCFFKNSPFLLIFWVIMYKTYPHSYFLLVLQLFKDGGLQRRIFQTQTHSPPSLMAASRLVTMTVLSVTIGRASLFWQLRFFFFGHGLYLNEVFCMWGCKFVSSQPEILEVVLKLWVTIR